MLEIAPDLDGHVVGLVPTDRGFLVYDGASDAAKQVPQLNGMKLCFVNAKSAPHLASLRERVVFDRTFSGDYMQDIEKLVAIINAARTALRRARRADGVALIQLTGISTPPLILGLLQSTGMPVEPEGGGTSRKPWWRFW